MAALLLWQGPAPSAMGQATKPPGQTLKERVVEIPAGSVVEIRLQNKEKLRGKLGPVSDSGFDVQLVREGKIQTQTVAFDQVQSVKVKGQGMGIGAKVTLGILAGIGIFFVVFIIVAAATGWD